MNKSETTSKLMPALIKARGEIKPAAKSGKNTFDKYDYAKEEDWHGAVMPALLANGLTLSFSITETINLPDRTTNNGKTEHAVEVHGLATLIHESGEWMEVGVTGQGQDRADKAIYKAMTGAKKYGYACLFALPTSDDPEKDAPPSPERKPLNPPPKQPKPIPGDQPAGYEKVLSEGLKYIAMVKDAAGANGMLAMLATTQHIGTSKNDLWKALLARAAVVGVAWNKEGKTFEAKS